MASNIILALTIASAVVPSVVLVYGSSWAFQIRRSLFSPIFRSQALWLGFFGLYLVPYNLGLDAGGNAHVAYDVIVVTYYIALARTKVAPCIRSTSLKDFEGSRP